MKDLGTTKNGGRIVEFSAEEYKAFVLAQNATKGLTLQDAWLNHPVNSELSSDMKQFLLAMKLFVEAKFKVNELEGFVSALKDQIGG